MAKFFRVALEGDTTDGRKITRQDILDCAETFDPKLYGVRVNLEHFRGLIPGGPFDMLGDVVAVKAQQDEIDVGGVKQQALGLYAQINPLPALVDINKKKQKLFTSIEIGQNCRGTGKAYLVGMATTDSPASFGCQALEFAAKNPGFYANRKSAEDNLLVQSHEVPAGAFEATAETEHHGEAAGIFAALKGMIEKFTAGQQAAPAPAAQTGTGQEPAPAKAEAAPDTGSAAAFAAFGALIGQMTASLDSFATATTAKVDTLAGDVAALKTALENTPRAGFAQRPAATGGADRARTDC